MDTLPGNHLQGCYYSPYEPNNAGAWSVKWVLSHWEKEIVGPTSSDI